jgi:hypothetical protein
MPLYLTHGKTYFLLQLTYFSDGETECMCVARDTG